jgi:hypothetical protein
MRPDFKVNLLIDDRIESYKSFFDHAWANLMMAKVKGTALDDAFFLLCTNWKAAANAQFMPWMMTSSIQSVEKGYLRPLPAFNERLLKDISASFGNFLVGDISNTLNKKLTKKVRAFIDQKLKDCNEVVQNTELEELKPENLFRSFLYGLGGAELQLSVYGAQRVCYAAIFFEYEHFVKTCIRILKKNPKYRPSRWEVLHDDTNLTLDAKTAATCLGDDAVKIGRLIRNCIAHNGGHLTEFERNNLPKGSFVEVDGFVRIVPEHNRTLFAALKDRVTIIAEAIFSKLGPETGEN